MAGRRGKNPTLAENATENVVAIFDHGRVFHLSRPINLRKAQREGLYEMDLPELEILEYGYTEQDALKSFSEHFGLMWDEVAQHPDRELTPGAQAVKRKMLSLVDRVEEQ